MTTRATIQYFKASRTPIPEPMNNLMRLSPTHDTSSANEKPVVVSNVVVAEPMSVSKIFVDCFYKFDPPPIVESGACRVWKPRHAPLSAIRQ